jgi:hypothetical protein
MSITDEKIIMVHSLVQLDDLPDEILLIILKRLDNDQVLYSLMGVNKRINTFVHDSIFTSHLTLMKRFANDSISPLSERILRRFYSQILPEIYIYKEERLFVCLFVLYAFSPCDSYDHQTFHSASLGPKEGRRGVGMVIGGWGEAG